MFHYFPLQTKDEEPSSSAEPAKAEESPSEKSKSSASTLPDKTNTEKKNEAEDIEKKNESDTEMKNESDDDDEKPLAALINTEDETGKKDKTVAEEQPPKKRGRPKVKF